MMILISLIIFKSPSTHSPTRKKVTASNHYNLTGNLCEKYVTQLGIDPGSLSLRAYALSLSYPITQMDGHVIIPATFTMLLLICQSLKPYLVKNNAIPQ